MARYSSEAAAAKHPQSKSRFRRRLPTFILTAVLFLYSMVCLAPLILVLSTSLTSETYITQNGYTMFPFDFSTEAYNLIMRNGDEVFRSYGVSILITVIGTIGAVIISACAGYTLANKEVKYRGALALFFYIPSLISGGVVPWYLINSVLGIKDNLAALIIPNLLFSTYNMYLVRNFMNSIPYSLRESAKIDGASDMRIAFQIYFPLSKPVLATVGLFYAIGYWNDWYNSVMLIMKNTKLYPLQYMLFRLQSQIDAAKELERMGIYKKLPSESYKMATVVITIGPIILLYPFLQKYFVKGLTIGAVKG